MSTQLSPPNEQFIQDLIVSGQYRSRVEVLERAVELLKRREHLLREVNAGVEQLNRGQFTEYDEQSLDRFLEDVRSEATRIEQGGKEA